MTTDAEHVHGYTAEKSSHLKRLRRIEGQVRGLQRMVEEDKYCIDILTQISAASNALKRVAVGLLEDHMRHCIAEKTEKDRDMIAEAAAAVDRLVKA